MGFTCGSAGKEFSCNAGHLGSIPGLGRSPGEGKGYPLQGSGLENSVNCIVHGVAESDITKKLSLSSPSMWLCHKFVIKLDLSVYISSSITWVSVLNLYMLHLLCDVQFYGFWQMHRIIYPLPQCYTKWYLHPKSCPVCLRSTESEISIKQNSQGDVWKNEMKSLSYVWLFATPWTVAY